MKVKNMPKKKAPRNRTLTVEKEDIKKYSKNLIQVKEKVSVKEITNKTINQDIFEVLDNLPDEFVDLLFIDPPYNLSKTYNSHKFNATSNDEYEQWVDSWMSKIPRLLKEDASIYVCCDWKSSNAIYNIISKYFKIQNRITWEREKGRGAKSNWKNCSEDIWFATKTNNYKFFVDRVKMKKKVIAPYRDATGKPKDWDEGENGNYRVTFPSNLWTDISIPFWSMPENTEHPTQKPEKLVAKTILASSEEGDFIFDPFLGSGTTSVVATKLRRKYLGIELDKKYCIIAEKRLNNIGNDTSIQGYYQGVFWERNSLKDQKKSPSKNKRQKNKLFEI